MPTNHQKPNKPGGRTPHPSTDQRASLEPSTGSIKRPGIPPANGRKTK